jgi:Holliday junction resolvase
MPIHSKNKGANGEREVRDLFKRFGFDAHRGQQFKGTPDSPDVVAKTNEPIHIEVKRVERFQLYEALKQAQADAGRATPLVFHRKNKERWVVVMDAEAFLEWFKQVDDLKNW